MKHKPCSFLLTKRRTKNSLGPFQCAPQLSHKMKTNRGKSYSLTSSSLPCEQRLTNPRDTTNPNLARPEERICLPLPSPSPSPYRGPGARYVLKQEASYSQKNGKINLPPTLSTSPFSAPRARAQVCWFWGCGLRVKHTCKREEGLMG